jgi:ornithine--oxo-acid transaminase
MGATSEYLCKLFGFDKFLPMNGGVEATETSVKLARRWAYRVKGVPDNEAVILMAKGCFWGRTITALSGSDDPIRYTHFGPTTPGFELVEYDNIEAIKQKFESDKNIAAIMLEPIQGEKGVIIPADGYLKAVKDLCVKHNVLLIIDEVQTGFGRTGKLSGYDWDGIKPDMVCLGKSLSGGMMPVSGVLADDAVMLTIKPGDHGSTYGGNPLAMAVSKVAVQCLVEEGMIENSLKMGDIFHEQLSAIKSPLIKEVRGKGLFRALELVSDCKATAGDFAYILMNNGIATKNTTATITKLAPPLIITEKQILEASKIIKESIRELEKVNKDKLV